MVLAAAVSNLDINWIDGIKGVDMPDKVLPSPGSHEHQRHGILELGEHI